MNRLRRFIGTFDTIARPLAATEPKRKVVMPPKTAAGIATIAAANFAKIPAASRKKLQSPVSRYKTSQIGRIVAIPAKISCFSIGTSRQRDNTVVLCKSCHRRDRHKGSEDAIETVCKKPALDSGVERLPLNFQLRYIACSCYITHGFTGGDDIDSEQW